jgi:RHS repeat-associated protein
MAQFSPAAPSPSVILTDQVNRKTQRVTDGLGRLVTVNEQDSSGNLTQGTNYTYDYLDALTQVDQGGQLRKYKYDALSRLLYEKIPEQTASINDGTGTYWTTKNTYTDYDKISTRTDARGVVTSYSYDSLHRLTQVSYNTVSGVTTAPTATYHYDYSGNYNITNQGELVSVYLGSGAVQYEEYYTVDSFKRPASTIRRLYTPGTLTYTTSYSLNEASQMTQLTHPSGLAIAVTHDSAGRVSGLQNASTQVNYLSSVTYNIAGQVTGDTLGNGVIEQFGYDAARMQLTSQKAGTSSPYTNRMNLTYSYSASSGQMGVGSTDGNADQLMAINNNSTINGTTESASYTYDNYGRLVTSSQTSNGSSAQRRFAYDRWGNRTGVWNATSGGTQIQSISLQGSGGIPTNQISSVTAGSTMNYTYDAAGDVTNDGVHSYTYDSENRIVSVDSGSTASYAYDHQNRRYKTTVGSAVTHYIWEGAQVIAEHNGSTGSVLIDYINSGGRMLAKVGSSTTSYFLNDHLSARMTLNTSGAVVGRQAHLPFGEDFGESGTQQKQHFTSYERDSESVTDHAVNRQYNQSVGRFNRVDPSSSSESFENPQTWQKYVYALNDAVNSTDPQGLNVEDPGGGIDPDPGPPPVPGSCSIIVNFGRGFPLTVNYPGLAFSDIPLPYKTGPVVTGNKKHGWFLYVFEVYAIYTGWSSLQNQYYFSQYAEDEEAWVGINPFTGREYASPYVHVPWHPDHPDREFYFNTINYASWVDTPGITRYRRPAPGAGTRHKLNPILGTFKWHFRFRGYDALHTFSCEVDATLLLYFDGSTTPHWIFAPGIW